MFGWLIGWACPCAHIAASNSEKSMSKPRFTSIAQMTVTSAVGRGWDAHLQALSEQRSGLQPNHFAGAAGLGWIGEVAGLSSVELPAELAAFDCRNNRLAWLALQQDGFLDAARAAVHQYGPERVAVFVGTSTSGIQQTERAYAETKGADALPAWFDYRHSHNVYSLGYFLRSIFGTRGPSACISTACSSSAKVFASAERALKLGLCDAAIVGGCDSLCLTTLRGFHSLQLVSEQACRPADAHRNGISIGEAAGFALLTLADAAPRAVLGYGESSDAHHMSSPDPDGAGAARAMQAALDRAALEPGALAYLNLHGTATPANDRAEDRAVCGVLGTDLPCSSTKGYTGHTLGAAGIVEAALALMALERGELPPSLNTQTLDPDFGSRILMQPQAARGRAVMSNSFGFGGSNCSLVLGATP